MSRISQIQFRRGTAFEWENSNPVLASGEPGLDLTNNYLKVGNGISNWNSLSAIGIELNSGVYNQYINIDNDYTLSIADNLVFVNTSNNSVVVQLPTATNIGGKQFTIKKIDGDNMLTIITSDSNETIDGNNSIDIHYQYESVNLVSNNSNWFVV